MAKKPVRTRSIGKASAACPIYSKKTGKRIRTKKERDECMKKAMIGPKRKKKSRSAKKKVTRKRKRK